MPAPHSSAQYRDLQASATRDPAGYWMQAAARVDWSTSPDRALDGAPPAYSWFPGGRTNAAVNAVQTHALGPAPDRVALRYRNERGDDAQDLTYAQLHERVLHTAAGLRALGLRKGDRVTVYMPN